MYYLFFVCFVEIEKGCYVENYILKPTYSKLIKRLLRLKFEQNKLLWGSKLQKQFEWKHNTMTKKCCHDILQSVNIFLNDWNNCKTWWSN